MLQQLKDFTTLNQNEYQNKIGIDYKTFENLLEIQGLLSHLGYDLDEIKAAFACGALDYINFEYWN